MIVRIAVWNITARSAMIVYITAKRLGSVGEDKQEFNALIIAVTTGLHGLYLEAASAP